MEEIKALKAIEQVVNTSEDVRINFANLKRMAKGLINKKKKHWTEECPIDLSEFDEREKIAFMFVFNSISFSYWGHPKWSSGYERGTWSMINSIKTAFDQGKPILNPDYLSEISEDDLEQILEGNTTIPLFERRLTILRELGGSIKDYTKFIYKCNFDALKFVDCLVLRMPSFKDESEYNGEIITFNKRAQLLSSDLGYLLGFSNMNRLTACADYILPMVLRFNHVFEYSPKLENIITNGKELPSGSKEEVEIRANTIWAVELMSRISGKTSMEINDYLWLAGNFIPETQSYHLTRTTAY